MQTDIELVAVELHDLQRPARPGLTGVNRVGQGGADALGAGRARGACKALGCQLMECLGKAADALAFLVQRVVGEGQAELPAGVEKSAMRIVEPAKLAGLADVGRALRQTPAQKQRQAVVALQQRRHRAGAAGRECARRRRHRLGPFVALGSGVGDQGPKAADAAVRMRLDASSDQREENAAPNARRCLDRLHGRAVNIEANRLYA